jgi:hypothetical protein
MKRALALVIVAALMLAGAACGTDNAPSGTNDPATDAPEPSVAYKLAVVHGDPSTEAAFQEVLDCIKASGIEGAETEGKIGDTLVAGWEQSGKRDSLLEWAQAFC